MKNNFKKLAKKIKQAGAEIAKDSISKVYLVWENEFGSISVVSDSGYESILISAAGGKNNPFMYLYSNNTSKRNSFPSQLDIENSLIKIQKKEKLETGEGKANYMKWDEFGTLENQLEIFSKIINEASKIL